LEDPIQSRVTEELTSQTKTKSSNSSKQ